MDMFELQRALGLTADGKRGPVTTAAILKAADDGRLTVTEAVAPPEPTGATLNSRSETNLRGVHADLVKVVRRAAELSPVAFTVIEGLRTVVVNGDADAQTGVAAHLVLCNRGMERRAFVNR